MKNGNQNWIYQTDLSDKIRYVLGIKGENPLFCIGLNPSTARPGALDNTMKFVQRLTFNNAFDSWVMLNLYPQRSTNPDNIHRRRSLKIHQENMEAIGNIFSGNEINIWAAWGTLIEKRPYLFTCLEDIYSLSQESNCNWFSIGRKSKAGHPHHPLYLKGDSKIERFDMEDYLRSFRR